LIQLQKNDKSIRFLITLVTTFLGGLVFSFLHIPVPWLLGPMAAVLIGSKLGKISFYWPVRIRDIGLMILGYSIGLAFTKEALTLIVAKLPLMLLLTVILVSFCAGIAWVVSKLTGVDYPTILIGSIPGGQSQMITFAEEMKGIDITTVTFLQVTRVLLIISFVPFLVFSPVFHQTAGSTVTPMNLQVTQSNSPIIGLFLVVCILSVYIGKKLRFPTPYLLGPILGAAILTILGLEGPPLPNALLDLSQFMIGSYIGLLLKPEKLENKTKIITLGIVSGVVMIFGSFILSSLLVKNIPITPTTSFLSLAPGGADQMAILAHEVEADISMVTGFQLFRLFFIYFAVPPILRWIFLKGSLAKSS
jgi:uncharacterized protein